MRFQGPCSPARPSNSSVPQEQGAWPTGNLPIRTSSTTTMIRARAKGGQVSSPRVSNPQRPQAGPQRLDQFFRRQALHLRGEGLEADIPAVAFLPQEVPLGAAGQTGPPPDHLPVLR